MSDITGTINQSGLRLKLLQRKIKFMEEYNEQVPKNNRKEFLAYLELIKQEERDIIEILEKTGGKMK